MWMVRLSFPIWLVIVLNDAINVAPKARQREYEQNAQNEVPKNKAKQDFIGMCEQHALQATQILQVIDSRMPRRLFVDEPYELSGPQLPVKLLECVTKRLTPACIDLKLDSIEWAFRHLERDGPCKRGAPTDKEAVFSDKESCIGGYRRYDHLDGNEFKLIEIDKPASDYVVRVGEAVPMGIGFESTRKYEITLEATRTKKMFAKTEIVVLSNSVRPAACPNPENEVAQMVWQVFQKH